MTADGSLPATSAPLSTPTELPAIQPIRAFGRDSKASHAPAWYEPRPTPPENTSEALNSGSFAATSCGWMVMLNSGAGDTAPSYGHSKSGASGNGAVAREVAGRGQSHSVARVDRSRRQQPRQLGWRAIIMTSNEDPEDSSDC